MHHPHLPPHPSAIADVRIPNGADISTLRLILAELQTKHAQQHKVRNLITGLALYGGSV